jgi:hypothetical protein
MTQAGKRNADPTGRLRREWNPVSSTPLAYVVTPGFGLAMPGATVELG